MLSSRMLLAAACFASALAQAGYDEGANAYQRGDYARALRELVPAADVDARAAGLLASMYERGLGATADARQALLWLRRAGELGDIQAQLELARRYVAGSAQDQREAVDWYTRAAQGGSAAAQYELATAYADGHGVSPDSAVAARWMEQAATGGERRAAKWLADAYAQGRGVEVDPARAAYWRGRATPPAQVASAQPRAEAPPPAYQALPERIDPACSNEYSYECERLQRERTWRWNYGFGWYSGRPEPGSDLWFWGSPWYIGPPGTWGWPYAGWGWGPGYRSGWSLGFTWGF